MKLTRSTIQPLLDHIAAVLTKEPRLVFAHLYGSVSGATGARDIDIAVYSTKAPDPHELKDIVDVQVMGGYQLHLCFEDGLEGIINVGSLVDFTGVFAPLRADDYFRKVRVNSELGSICWPNGADLDPDVLYSLISREPIVVAEHEALSVA